MLLPPCPAECGTEDLPYIQRSGKGSRVVCKCGTSSGWRRKREDALEAWRKLPRVLEYSTVRPREPGPCWCKAPDGEESIVDLTEADVAGTNLTMWCYTEFCPIRKPK